ncbi:unnamed protein product [Heterobilharzia americana]|nr:unnamed protein product [Heterobilharzia americana]
MRNIHLILFIVSAIGIFLVNANNAEKFPLPQTNNLECEICIGLVNLGKVFLLSPSVDHLGELVVGRLCTLPGIVTKRCIPWGRNVVEQTLYSIVRINSTEICYVSTTVLNYCKSTQITIFRFNIFMRTCIYAIPL